MKTPELTGLQSARSLERQPFSTRASVYSTYLRAQFRDGLPVMREVVGPMGRIVPVKDPRSGRIQEMLMFGSNSYLDLANHPEVKPLLDAHIERYGLGLGGPPMFNGTTGLHKLLERRLAEFKGTEDAMLFSSGFQAGHGLLSTIAARRDALILDELAHASLKEGARASKAVLYGFPHNDLDGLEAALQRATADDRLTKIVVVEGVYSMDGDVPPLDRIFEITRRHGGMLVLDDAHGTGVLGRGGRGTAERFGLEGELDFILGTFSKSLASTGGFIAAKRQYTDYLRFFAKSYFFSASVPPVLVAQILANLTVLLTHPELQLQLIDNVTYLRKRLLEVGIPIETDSAIIPVPVPAHAPIRDLARRFHEDGIFVNHVEFPAVAADKQRFRVGVMASHTRDDLERLVAAFASIYGEAGLIPEAHARTSSPDPTRSSNASL